MSDRLEYRFGDSANWGESWLEISTTKSFIDGATARRGPMLDEVRQPLTKKVLTRGPAVGGDITVGFDLQAMGTGYSGQPQERAARAMAIVSQIDSVASQLGQSDPRISLSNEYGDGPATYLSAMISFERPADSSDDELAKKIQTGMLRAAKLLRFFNTQQDDRRMISATHNEKDGFKLSIGCPVFSSHPDHPQVDGRVELLNTSPHIVSGREEHARLIAFTGIVSVLGPIVSSE